MDYVKEAYPHSFGPDQSDNAHLALGHALGRVASAVSGSPEREQAFACLELGVEQVVNLQSLVTGIKWKEAMQAAMGMHDARVATLFRVTDSSPLDVVFENALRIAGRSPSGAGAPTPVAGGSGTIVKADPAAMFGVSSTAPSRSGSNTSCTVGDRWSLDQATAFLGAASTQSRSVANGSCTGEAWFTCKAMSNLLNEARDHIFQVFDQNHDGIANCRLCNYDQVLATAQQLIGYEKFLTDRNYNASGLSTIYYTIRDNSGDPLCRIDAGGGSSSGGGLAGGDVTPAARANRNDPSAWTDGCWYQYDRYLKTQSGADGAGGGFYRGTVMVVGYDRSANEHHCEVTRFQPQDQAVDSAMRSCRNRLASDSDSCEILLRLPW